MGTDKINYFDLIYQVVREIPRGRVTSYGAIAHYLGLKSGARMVGYAMNAAHTMTDVPAQRVVNRQGLLTGKHHFETSTQMQELLEADGISVENDQIKNFETVFWDPEKELGL
ncbi:methylated-DNA-protein-cysteine methyltransferase related protein [Algoriphagus alkaliphilus]|uniref:Methylated-DNA-protein-cysteine methyltransferase related protein n=1 Tax=Algoriphagus alkaliphilus TaxID=279824 RepID=A0A1G5XNY8_9BACT|nr:MGMT family protein [Algoriphagus alkaliphilus]MBA4302362.1 cysteine methyltransferase [Cyclobacterium sp.]SDA71634.1 methylated-DNA-protein-cysteine methyltransferase related protein [Algoriphagus alkaliphilus]